MQRAAPHVACLTCCFHAGNAAVARPRDAPSAPCHATLTVFECPLWTLRVSQMFSTSSEPSAATYAAAQPSFTPFSSVAAFPTGIATCDANCRHHDRHEGHVRVEGVCCFSSQHTRVGFDCQRHRVRAGGKCSGPRRAHGDSPRPLVRPSWVLQ